MKKDLLSDDAHAIGARLRYIRDANRLLQGEMAKKLAISASQYSKCEIGARKLGGSAIRTLCMQFGVDEGWLLTGIGTTYSIEREPSNQPMAVREPAREYRVAKIQPITLRQAMEVIAEQMEVSESVIMRGIQKAIEEDEVKE